MKSLETHALAFYIKSITQQDRSLHSRNRVLYFILHLLTRERRFRFSTNFQNAVREKLHYLYFCGTIRVRLVCQLEEELRIRARCISGRNISGRNITWRCSNITTHWNSVYCDFHAKIATINQKQLQGLLHAHMTPNVAKMTMEYVF
jgi:hypothetical protein